MALTNMRFKDQIGLNLGEETMEKKRRTVERRRKREKKRKRKKHKRRREGEKFKQSKRFGTIWFCMDFLSRYMFVGCGL